MGLKWAWRTRGERVDFEKECSAMAKENWHIQAVTYIRDRWFAFWWKDEPSPGLTWAWRTRATPEEVGQELSAMAKKSYLCTSLAYGNGWWFEYLEKKSSENWKWAYRNSWSVIKDFLDENLPNGYRISAMAYGNGWWYAFLSKTSSKPAWKWSKRGTLIEIKERMEELAAEGYTISQIVKGESEWFVYGEKVSGGQYIVTDHGTAEEMTEELTPLWKKGLITWATCFGDGRIISFSQKRGGVTSPISSPVSSPVSSPAPARAKSPVKTKSPAPKKSTKTQGKKFDAFLSHCQATGGDLAQSIKLQLLQIDPELEIFLDVDDLETLHILEENVGLSENFILLITDQTMERPFVQKEIRAAKKHNLNIILVHDEKSCAFPNPDAVPEDIRDVLQIKAIPYYREKAFREVSIKQIYSKFV